jgi:hypothetical protein
MRSDGVCVCLIDGMDSCLFYKACYDPCRCYVYCHGASRVLLEEEYPLLLGARTVIQRVS